MIRVVGVLKRRSVMKLKDMFNINTTQRRRGKYSLKLNQDMTVMKLPMTILVGAHNKFIVIVQKICTNILKDQLAL